MFDVNLRGSWLLAKNCYPHLKFWGLQSDKGGAYHACADARPRVGG
jgi:hypothetical protein